MTRPIASLLAFLSLAVIARTAFVYDRQERTGDLARYKAIALQVLRPAQPGVIESEYPPLATALFVATEAQPLLKPYQRAWMAMLLVALLLACAYASVRLAPWDLAAVPAAAALSLVLLGGEAHLLRFDLLVGLALFLAWRAHESGRHADAGVLAALAGSLKLVPFVAAPVLFLLCPPERRARFAAGFLGGLTASGAVALLALGPQAVAGNLVHMAGYHGTRGYQVESTWAGADLLGRNLRGERALIDLRSGAYEDLDVPVPLAVPLIISVAGLLALVVLLRRHAAGRDAAPPLLAAFLWLFSFGSVLSPQYFVWVTPIMLAWSAQRWRAGGSRWDAAFAVLLITLCLATQWIYPWHYTAFINQQSLALTLVQNLRNAALLGLTALLAWRLARGRGDTPPHHR